MPLPYEGADESHRLGENSRARELHCTHIPLSPVILSVLRMFITATETRKRLCAPAGDSVPASRDYDPRNSEVTSPDNVRKYPLGQDKFGSHAEGVFTAHESEL